MSRSSLSFFLLIASFGILFAGCGASEPDSAFEDFTFTEEDLEAIHQMTDEEEPDAASETGSGVVLSVTDQGTDTTLSDTTLPAVDESVRSLYSGVRTAVGEQGAGIYRVNNQFLNVRAGMIVTSAQVATLYEGDLVTVLEMPNAEWAKVKLKDDKEGYVAFRYLARMTTEEKLAAEKKAFEGKYFVDYGFVNMRKEPSTQAEKVIEVPGKTILKPSSIGNGWARVSYEGKDGYVSMQYLTAFMPSFLVRQESYSLPILQYTADDSASIAALPAHIAALKQAGKRIVTMKTLMDTVLGQESRDTRLPPNVVVLTIAGVNAMNLSGVTAAIAEAGVNATLFIQTKDLGITGITEKTVLTLLANGNEIQSGGHTGDDLRTMTDAQVSLELAQSKKLIEDMTKREVYVIQYARGGINDRILSEAEKRAYLFGISQSPDSRFTRSQFLRLPTLMVGSGMDGEDVVKLIQ
ncbi:MAG: SH3 domain-containing protein [Candidatus Peribacteraceae bacterium]